MMRVSDGTDNKAQWHNPERVKRGEVSPGRGSRKERKYGPSRRVISLTSDDIFKQSTL